MLTPDQEQPLAEFQLTFERDFKQLKI